MTSSYWKNDDFEVFEIEGLEERMEALSEIVRPKFHHLGDEYATYLSAKTGEEFFVHVAKHARRTVNPPKDSWVAFAPYKRGYKSLPHFQIGLWRTHLFIVFAIIYEAPHKDDMANRLLNNIQLLNDLPDDYILSGDHMSPEVLNLGESRDESLEKLIVRLRDIKKGEFLVGRHIPKEQANKMSYEEFMQFTTETFESLIPIYRCVIGK